jgi:hypothetical protein
MTSIHNIISAISPDIYCEKDKIKEVKKIIISEGYLKAAEEAEPIKNVEPFDYDEAKKDPFDLWGIKFPTEKHELEYDSPAENLEPIYFWILDFLEKLYSDTEKITDNFTSSAGSGHFSEIMGKATQMQQEVSRNMGTINQIIKSILQLVYDLKEFKLKLNPYSNLKSEDKKKKEAGLLSLKQIWMDNVDIKRGRGSINGLSAAELDFTTLRDAFLVVKSSKDIEKLDLNNRVKRILKQRADEFFKWIDESESSLRQRYTIEKNYLKSQVNSLKLTVKWVKPYLKAAQQLQQSQTSMQAALVTTFNTKILELVLLAKSEYKPSDDVNEGTLPDMFEKIKTRKYYSVIIVEFNFRSIPQRVSQRGDWAFGGRTKVKFTGYALNEQELKVLKEELEKDDVGEAMKLIEGATTESLEAIQKDIDDLLEEKPMEKSYNRTNKDDSNPFTALFSFLKPKKDKGKEKKEEDLSKGIKPDNNYEKVIRSQTIISARKKCFDVFDVYKKVHGMPSHQTYFEPL